MRKKTWAFFLRLVAALCCTVMLAVPAFAYEQWWWIDGDGYWFYTMQDGTTATSTWIHDTDDGEWYLLSGTGAMLTRVIYTNGHYYLLDTVRGTGTYGKLLKNGEYYNGVTLRADTSPEYEGALTDDCIEDLMESGVSFSGVRSLANTQQVENGAVTAESANRFADEARLQSYVGTYKYQKTTKNKKTPSNSGDINPFDYIVVTRNEDGTLHLKLQYTYDMDWGSVDVLPDENGKATSYSDKVGPKLKNQLKSINATHIYTFDGTMLIHDQDSTRVRKGQSTKRHYEVIDVYQKQ